LKSIRTFNRFSGTSTKTALPSRTLSIPKSPFTTPAEMKSPPSSILLRVRNYLSTSVKTSKPLKNNSLKTATLSFNKEKRLTKYMKSINLSYRN
jgi:hypothetical protein